MPNWIPPWRRDQDRLTGLAGQRQFSRAAGRSLAGEGVTGMLVVNLNAFSAVNASMGFAVGDRALTAFAGLLRRCAPPPAVVSRLGGDEFGVILPDLAFPEQAYEAAGRVAAAVAPVVIQGRLVALSCAIGVAVGPSYDVLTDRSRAAMRRAKSLGPATRWAAWQEGHEMPGAA